MIWTGTIRNFGRLAKGELTRYWSKQDGFNQPWEPCYQIFGIIIRFNHKICSQPWSYSFVESPPFALLCFQSEWKMAHLILVSNMIDRDAAFSLKRLDGSGPFSGLTQLHAIYFFLSNLFCGFLFDWVSRIWVLYFDLIFFYTRWNCEKARFALVGCDFFYFDSISFIFFETVKRLGLNWLDVSFLFDWNYRAAPDHKPTQSF